MSFVYPEKLCWQKVNQPLIQLAQSQSLSCVEKKLKYYCAQTFNKDYSIIIIIIIIIIIYKHCPK